MKKLLKSEICGSMNSAHHALFTEKVKYFGSKKKKKKNRRNAKHAFGKHKCASQTHPRLISQIMQNLSDICWVSLLLIFRGLTFYRVGIRNFVRHWTQICEISQNEFNRVYQCLGVRLEEKTRKLETQEKLQRKWKERLNKEREKET